MIGGQVCNCPAYGGQQRHNTGCSLGGSTLCDSCGEMYGVKPADMATVMAYDLGVGEIDEERLARALRAWRRIFVDAADPDRWYADSAAVIAKSYREDTDGGSRISGDGRTPMHAEPRRCIHGRTERQACAKCNEPDRPLWVKHMVKEGARYHVISWSNLGRKCSEPRCEINREDTE